MAESDERRVVNLQQAEAIADDAFFAWKDNDFELAESLWQKAASLGSSRAMVNLGRNRLEEEAFDQAREWFLQAVDLGNPDGAFFLGRMAIDAGDEVEGERWRWVAAELGDGPMLWWLANREKDPDPAETFNVELMTRAAQANFHKACGQLSSRAILSENYEECIEWGERALVLQEQETEKVLLAQLHGMVGAAYWYLGQPSTALLHYECALGVAPDSDFEIDGDVLAELRFHACATNLQESMKLDVESPRASK